MSSSPHTDPPGPACAGPQPPPVFVTTHWSVVLTAGQQDTPRAQAALQTLCQTYWLPLYAYVRRRGYAPAEAQDLTQECFARLLERNRFAGVSPEKAFERRWAITLLEQVH